MQLYLRLQTTWRSYWRVGDSSFVFKRDAWIGCCGYNNISFNQPFFYNTMRPADGYMPQKTVLSLAQIMTCCLHHAIPLAEPMLARYQTNLWKQIVAEWLSNHKDFQSWKLNKNLVYKMVSILHDFNVMMDKQFRINARIVAHEVVILK